MTKPGKIILTAILIFMTAFFTGCGAVDFPNLSEYGIDKKDFKNMIDPVYNDFDADNSNAIEFIGYNNSNHDVFLFCPDGSFYSYTKSASSPTDPNKTLSAEEYKKIACGALKKIKRNIDSFDETLNTTTHFKFEKKSGNYTEHAEIELDTDGSIKYIKVSNSIKPKDAVVERLTKKAQTTAEGRWKDSGFNYVTVNYAVDYFKMAGETYGIFDYTVSKGDPEAFGCYNVLVCDN